MSTPRSAEAWRVSAFTGNARFELRQEIGQGAMGTVYEAYDREREMTVALKVVHELDAHGLYRLKTEFRARADLEHRNVVRLGELFEDDGHWFFTMELIEGWQFVEWVRAAVIGVPHTTRVTRWRAGCATTCGSSRRASRSCTAAGWCTAI
jgi:hypothetical protein